MTYFCAGAGYARGTGVCVFRFTILTLRPAKILSRKNHTGYCCARQCSEPRTNQAPFRGDIFVEIQPKTYPSSVPPSFNFDAASRSGIFRLVGVHAKRSSQTKRQRAGALHDASRISEIIVPRAASWTAVALHRFSQRHGHPLPSDGRGTRRRIVRCLSENSRDWICRTLISKIRNVRLLFLLPGEKVRLRAGKTPFHSAYLAPEQAEA